jgi:hypothetical protein
VQVRLILKSFLHLLPKSQNQNTRDCLVEKNTVFICWKTTMLHELGNQSLSNAVTIEKYVSWVLPCKICQMKNAWMLVLCRTLLPAGCSVQNNPLFYTEHAGYKSIVLGLLWAY